uniref:Uncharacterized protein n=1 Tax=Moniliophthora roreri TaxID=221103 RepID=A0A0W0F7E7_MONRR
MLFSYQNPHKQANYVRLIHYNLILLDAIL